MPLTDFIEFEKTEIPEKIKYQVQAFSVYRGVTDYVTGVSSGIEIKQEIYYYRRWIKMVENSKKRTGLTWIVNNMKRIGEELQNKDFDKKDLTLAFLFLYYNSKHLNLTVVKKNLVLAIIDKFSDKQYEKDKEFVLSICKEIKIKGIEDFFKIMEDGTNLLYKYIQREYISPIFYIRLVGKVPTHNIEKQNDNYKKFTKLSHAIRDLLTTN